LWGRLADLEDRTFAIVFVSLCVQIVGILQLPEFLGSSFSPFRAVPNLFVKVFSVLGASSPSPETKKDRDLGLTNGSKKLVKKDRDLGLTNGSKKLEKKDRENGLTNGSKKLEDKEIDTPATKKKRSRKKKTA
jgi:predicted alpha/beta superfamily hydrolase